jgi:hypothetical protein
MTSASGMKCRNKVGIAARPQDQLPAGQGLGLQRSRPNAPPSPAITRVTPSATRLSAPTNSRRLARNQAWLTR